MKHMLGKTTKFATLNIRGIKKPGVREETDLWMSEKQIDILCLQETRNNQNSRETMKTTHGFLVAKEEGKNTQLELEWL